MDVARTVKMRGMGKGDMVDPDFFIILDRLEETLVKRMNRWYKETRKYNVTFLGMCRNKKGLAELMLERVTVAYDLAAAFMYLHENRCVCRGCIFLCVELLNFSHLHSCDCPSSSRVLLQTGVSG